MVFIDVNNLLTDLQILSRNGEYEKIKTLTQKFEKHILDNCKNNYELTELLDDLTLYSNYTVLNTLLIKAQYPNFLSLGTKKHFNDNGIKLLNGATPIKILQPINEEFVSVITDNKEIIKSINELSKTELKQYYDKENSNIKFHHKDFKGLQTIELFDVKDTDMNKKDYKQGQLPALFSFSCNDIYNSFVKALYADGYKIKYEKMDQKVSYNKSTKTISLNNGINKQVSLSLLLDIYTSDVSNNEIEKDLLNNTICRHIGMQTNDINHSTFSDWYKNEDPKNVDHLLKILVNKGRKFINNFNRFFELEKEQIGYETSNLYDDYILSI